MPLYGRLSRTITRDPPDEIDVNRSSTIATIRVSKHTSTTLRNIPSDTFEEDTIKDLGKKL